MSVIVMFITLVKVLLYILMLKPEVQHLKLYIPYLYNAVFTHSYFNILAFAPPTYTFIIFY